MPPSGSTVFRETAPDSEAAPSPDRRRFLQWAGVGVVAAVAGCGENITNTNIPDAPPPPPGESPPIVNLGSGDLGILNYAYALEQLEAAFYAAVVANLYAGATTQEVQILTDIRDHEIVHRDFLKTALAGSAIPNLTVNFSTIDFGSRTSVLTTARTFEDLGVSAYNGAGRRLSDPNLLLVAGKIVSVEARHAAAIRDLLAPKTPAFAGDDVVDARGLDVAREPVAVIAAADPFIFEILNPSQLPRG